MFASVKLAYLRNIDIIVTTHDYHGTKYIGSNFPVSYACSDTVNSIQAYVNSIKAKCWEDSWKLCLRAPKHIGCQVYN